MDSAHFRAFLEDNDSEIFPSAWAAFRSAICSLHAGATVSIHEGHALVGSARKELPRWSRKYLEVAGHRALQTPIRRDSILELLALTERATDHELDATAAQRHIESWLLRYQTPRPDGISSG